MFLVTLTSTKLENSMCFLKSSVWFVKIILYKERKLYQTIVNRDEWIVNQAWSIPLKNETTGYTVFIKFL